MAFGFRFGQFGFGSRGGASEPLELMPSLIAAGMNHVWIADPDELTFDVTETDEVTTAEDVIGDPADIDASTVSSRRPHWVASSADFNGHPAFIWDNATTGGLLRMPSSFAQNINSLAFMMPVVQATTVVNATIIRIDAGADDKRFTADINATRAVTLASRRLDADEPEQNLSSATGLITFGTPAVLFFGANWATGDMLIQINNATVASQTEIAGWDGPTSNTASQASNVNLGAPSNATSSAIRSGPMIGCWRNNWPDASERELAYRAMRDNFGPF